MHFSTTTFIAALLTSVVKADYYVDPASVSDSNRAAWCQSELSTCPLICSQIDDGDTKVNECDPVRISGHVLVESGLANKRYHDTRTRSHTAASAEMDRPPTFPSTP